ncbi:MAG: inorganic diphosphatase [Myxococcota bacterium]|nr:inorganic diphosphatase [Myxococcota bacterium]
MVSDSLPAQVRFVIEVPRGGFIKWGADGSIDYVSPIPSPFNYGSAPEHPGQDGDPADVVVLGRRRRRGETEVMSVWGRVRFLDQGHQDDKWICAARAPRRRERIALEVFFRIYAVPKSIIGSFMKTGSSRFEGIELRA